MDNTVFDKEIKTEFYTLKNVLIVNFIDAIDSKNYKIIGDDCTETNFNNLYIDYILQIEDNSKKTGIHKRIDSLEKEYFIVLKLGLFLNESYSVEMLSILRKEYNYDLPDKYNGKDIKDMLDKNELIINRIKLMEGRLPPKNIKKDSGENRSIYDIVTNLSLASGFDLDYDKLTIIKFIAYIKALRNREE